MAGLRRLVVGLCLVVFVLAGGAIANGAEPKLDDNWHFTLIPYVWLPSVDGKMNVNLPERSGSGSADLSPDSYLDNLNFAAMVTIEVAKGRWSLLSDFVYVKFEDEDRKASFSGPFGKGIDFKAKTELQAWCLEIAPSYAVHLSESARFDLLAGIRYIEIDGDLTLDASTTLPVEIPSRKFSPGTDKLDPIVGFRGRFELGKGWFIPYYADIGGFNINDEWTWQLYGGIGYQFSKLFSMTLGYRHLEYNFDDGEPIEDLYLSGGQLGFVFRF